MADIGWFPGHMMKAKRLIESCLPLIDVCAELCDARIPFASINEDLRVILGSKPRIMLLNKCTLADEKATMEWLNYYKENKITALAIDAKTGLNANNVIPAIKAKVVPELILRRKNKGISAQPLRLMILGIPNVGKSTFINRLAGKSIAKTEDRPGVTRTKQWVKVNGAEMLDMPGVLPPKLSDQNVAINLAFTGAIKDAILDIETLAMKFLEQISQNYGDSLAKRFGIPFEGDGISMLTAAAKKRGMFISGGEPDLERAAIMVLDEFRAGKIGRITLESAAD